MVRCLVIERNAAERLRLCDMLQSLGIECLDGATVEGATVPDILLAEARSEDLIQLVRLHHLDPHKTAIFLYADRPDLEGVGASILAGATDFLVRPFDRELLRFKLQQAGVVLH